MPCQNPTYTPVQPQNNPVPTLSNLSPTSVKAGSGTFTLTANGTNLLGTATTLHFGSSVLPTISSTTTSTSATVPAALIANAGSVAVTLVNPPPGGGASNTMTFTTTAKVTQTQADICKPFLDFVQNILPTVYPHDTASVQRIAAWHDYLAAELAKIPA